MSTAAASSTAVSAQMRAQRERDTPREAELRRRIYAKGYRYLIHAKVVPGTRREADLAFRTSKVAVFLDGCFWHGCRDCKTIPKTNREFWRKKIDENRARDADTDRRLHEVGWISVRIWEHESLEDAVARVEAVLPARGVAKRNVVPKDDLEHGKVGTYSNHRCRCAACRKANSDQQRRLKARYAAEGGRGVHGSDYRYRTGCRCDDCRRAHADADRAYRAQRKAGSVS